MLLVMTVLYSCDNGDDENPNMPPLETGNRKSFTLYADSTNQPGGRATFVELEGNSTRIEIVLNDSDASEIHPTHIHYNSAASGGDIAITLESVDGADGTSQTEVRTLDDGTAISYNELLDFNGHINIHQSQLQLNTIIAFGDIGINELTDNSEVYELNEKDIQNVAGTITFVERVNGATLSIIALENTPGGQVHPAHIHYNSVIEGGSIAITLNPVIGGIGSSMTDITALDDGNPISFDELNDFDGHVNVHLSASNLSIIVANGNIGSNSP